jgi:hypothetical protein
MLPEFDQLALDRRFLTELDRLHRSGAFTSYREVCAQLGAQLSLRALIVEGKYHCNLRLLYNLRRHYPQADLVFVLEGGAAAGRPEPADFPPAPKLGAPFGRTAPTATRKRAKPTQNHTQ